MVQAGQGSDSWGHRGDMEGMGQYWRGWLGAVLRVAGEMLTGRRWLSWCRGGGEGRRRAVLMAGAGWCGQWCL